MTNTRYAFVELSETQSDIIADAIATIGGMPSECELRMRGIQVAGMTLKADADTLLRLRNAVHANRPMLRRDQRNHTRVQNMLREAGHRIGVPRLPSLSSMRRQRGLS